MDSLLSVAAQRITNGPFAGQLWQSAPDASLAMTDSPPIHDDSYPTGDDTPPHTGANPVRVTERHAVLRSEQIGRFVVLRELGAGGMGVVYSAFDEALGRRVAVKLLFASRAANENARRRLEREAQALARLSHPNVVQVHEVGEHAGDMFVAMEFVKGATLEAWAKAEPRSWREVVACYLQAARGLQAAHDAGVLHRDFKPANAILGDDGRVRVLDFGLARTSEQPELLPDDVGRMGESASGQDERLTATGSVLGTPAYMAPEQFFGDPVDARTDVFSFCVSLYEALYGERPFQGKTRYALLRSVLSGPPKLPERGVPARIEQLLRRGLAREPDSRPQSMHEVVTILDFDPLRKRRWWLMGGTIALVASGAGLGGSMLSEASPPCPGFEQELWGVWDDERRAEVEAAFERSGSDLSEAVWPRVAGALDERAEALVSGMQAACEATHVAGKQSEARLDRRMTCLDDRKRSMRALTEVLGRADRLTVAHAEDAVQGLPSPDVCADPQWLDASLEPPRDEAQQQQVAQVREQLATGQALVDTGHYLEAKTVADQGWSEAETVAYGPLSAEAGLLRSTVDTKLGRYRSARTTILDVVDLAEATRHDQLAAKAWLWLIYLDAQMLGDRTHVDVWIRRAAAAGRRVGEPVDDRIELLSQQALWAIDRGDADAARRYIDEGTLLQDEARPSSTFRNLNLENARVELAQIQGQHDAALELGKNKLQHHLAVEPAGHPRIALARLNLGHAFMDLGKLEDAREQYAKAWEILKQTFGMQPHPNVGTAEMSLGVVALYSRDVAAAKDYMERAVATMEASVGPVQPKAAQALNNLGVVAFMQGELRASATYTQRALDIYAQSYGEDHIEWGKTAINLGEMLLYLDELEQARSLIERGASVISANLPNQHAGRALSLKLEGFILLLDGRPADAEIPLSRSLDLCIPTHAQERADITIALAIATWHRDPEQALEIAQSHEAKLDDETSRERRLSLVRLLAQYQTAINALGLDS